MRFLLLYFLKEGEIKAEPSCFGAWSTERCEPSWVGSAATSCVPTAISSSFSPSLSQFSWRGGTGAAMCWWRLQIRPCQFCWELIKAGAPHAGAVPAPAVAPWAANIPLSLSIVRRAAGTEGRRDVDIQGKPSPTTSPGWTSIPHPIKISLAKPVSAHECQALPA